MNKLPDRDEVINVINQLKLGVAERKSVAKWAFSLIDNDEIIVTDQIVWKVIQNLGAVDLPSSDRDYLYDFEDFDDWKKSLKS